MIIVWIHKNPLEEESYLYYDKIEERHKFARGMNPNGTPKKEGNNDEYEDDYKIRVPNKMIGRIVLKRIAAKDEKINNILEYLQQYKNRGNIIIRHEKNRYLL